MLGLVKVAVTGGLACGKSSACRFFKKLGAHVVSADDIVHQLLSPATTLGKQVINLLGPDIVVENLIDRAEIAKRVFGHPELLRSLEKLLHPAVKKEIEKQYNKVKREGVAPLFIAEIPLLFESNGETWFDYSIAIVANHDTCLARFKHATQYSSEEFAKRAARQMSHEEKAKLADYVIENNGTLVELQKSVKKLFNVLTHRPKKN